MNIVMDNLFPTSLRPLDPLSLDCVLHHTPIPDIMVLMRACSQWRHECLSYIRRKRVDLLRSYFDDHLAFQHLLRATASILAGVEVLDFVLHGTSLPLLHAPSLEIHVGCVHGDAVVQHLRDLEGYYVCPAPSFSTGHLLEESLDGIAETVYLAHPSKAKRIDVICGLQLSSYFTLAHAPCSLAMNYLSADTLVVAHPLLTFRGVNIENPLLDDLEERARETYFYQKRGFLTGVLDWRMVSSICLICPPLLTSVQWCVLDGMPIGAPAPPTFLDLVRVFSCFSGTRR